ncbi:MAG: D-aminoacyl-tRNA deacylase [Euryarchaeota archaeon]|nr:D-aminoacyl-tRNA deacylase [Euryarchaeota archaeon]MDE1880212.1 D-aminoacyl-tRNA deacylase [Euryarchaeota archaeon]MDE2044409.1 D-aminoacyl-tRNA deacylase [Thermoplasmata archaeon]
MKIVVASQEDPVGRAVGELLGAGEPTDLRVGAERIRKLSEGLYVLKRAGLHIHDARLEHELPSEVVVQTEALIFPSVHRSESNRPALTVHPLGNLTDEVEVGGLPLEVNPVPARLMTEAFLRWYDAGERFGVETTFEATHHGPHLRSPSYFIEIGSTAREWERPELLKALAEVLRGLGTDPLVHAPVVLGVGGGHYMPRFRDLVRRRQLAVGHLVPSHHLPSIGQEMAEQLVARTPGVQGVVFARADDAQRSPLKELLPELREKELRPRSSQGTTSNA